MLKNLSRCSAHALLASGARALFAILALAAFPLDPVAGEVPPLVVGFVYVTPVGEAGWTFQHELGRRELERALGPRVKTVAVESVAEGPDAERVIRDLVVAQGARLVFATSFGYLD
ncbi:MAG: BMP family ABC transporter substrate-binding protein, partial [Caldimonas sp.]